MEMEYFFKLVGITPKILFEVILTTSLLRQHADVEKNSISVKKKGWINEIY